MNRKKNWPLRLAMVEFTYWFALGTVNYLTVYLEGNGFSVTQVGLINTVNALAATLFSPVAGVISDKIRSSLKGMIVFTTAMCICYALVPLTMKIYILGMSLMIVFSAMYYAFSVPSESLLETTVVRGCENTGTDFATIRIGGTLGYVVVCALLSYFVTDDNVIITFYLLGLLILPAFYAMSRIKEVSDSSGVQERIALKDLPFGKLFRNPYFVCYAIFTILHFVPQMSVYYFQPYLIKDVGASMTYVGYLQAYRALFEVPALLFSYKISRKISLRDMVIISAILYAVQSFLYFGVNSFLQILAVTTLSGLGTGFYLAGGIRYVSEVAPEELQSTAQTVIFSIRSLSGVLGGYFGAMLIEMWGLREFYVSTGVVMLFSAVFLYVTTIIIKKSGNH